MVTEKEQKLIDELKKIGLDIPFGDVFVRFIYQDGVIVRMVVEDKKPSIKF